MARFIDEIEIAVSSGRGGPGSVSFRRESFAPRGGPDGGDGGKGGDLIFRVNTSLVSLVDFKLHKRYAAENGIPGASANCTGRDGQNLVLEVPPGTLIKSETGDVLFDMAKQNEVVFLKGGRGGKGNHFFKTSVNQAPEYAQPGEDAEESAITLELKAIADVGIIGFPNAGKSTFITRISAAKPKIADYPFTTLTPNLGVVRISVDRNFVVADIPGLIKGASSGIGLGIQFLRHIERTRIFVHLIDVSGFSGRDPWQDYLDISGELEAYDVLQKEEANYEPLRQRPELVVLNKIDALQIEELAAIKSKFERNLGHKVFTISAITGKHVKELVETISNQLLELAPAAPGKDLQ